MNLLMLYLLKVSLLASITWLLYVAFFRRLTFFRFNRFYFLGGTFISFLLPLIPNPAPGLDLVIPAFDEFFPGGITSTNETLAGMESTGVNSAHFPVLLYLSLGISLFYLSGLLLQYFRLKAEDRSALVLRRGRLRLVIRESLPSAFTLFSSVYIDRHIYQNRLMPVIRHEWVHAREGHSYDLLFMELAFALLWFNPFVFLLRKAVRENLEYLADEQSSGAGNTLAYLEMLRSELVRRHELALANYFKSSTLKKRIMMLVKHRSNRKLRWSYLLVLPVMVLLLSAFHAPESIPGPKVLLNANPPVALEPEKPEKGIPHVFPLAAEFKEKISWNYGVEAKNPITGELQVHGGIDISAPEGSPVYATGDGIVAKVIEDKGWGKLVILKHEKEFSTWYAHLSAFKVSAGQEIKAGQVLGYVGNTGYSTGPHLHYEVRINGERVNPGDYY